MQTKTKCIDFYMHPFNVTHLLTFCLLIFTSVKASKYRLITDDGLE